MFDKFYEEWCRCRTKSLIDFYNYKFFYGKTVLDLGAGHGDIAIALARLGADVMCADARQENLNVINKKYPFIKTIKVDLDNEWPFIQNQFDIVLSLGLLCHLKDHKKHLSNICSVASTII